MQCCMKHLINRNLILVWAPPEADPGPTVGCKQFIWDAIPERTDEEREKVKQGRDRSASKVCRLQLGLSSPGASEKQLGAGPESSDQGMGRLRLIPPFPSPWTGVLP